MISLALLPLTLQPPSLQRAVTVAGGSLLRQAAILSCSTLLATAHLSPALAATAATSAPPCALECFRECNVVAPGNKEYCSRQCDSYCAEVGDEAAGKNDVLRSDPSMAAPAAKVAVGGLSTATDEDTAIPSKDLGIFGDSGVTYSSGLEDLLATAFGAKRQSKPVNEADVAGFASEIGEAAKNAILGK